MSSLYEKFDINKHFTYADLLEMDDDIRTEIVHGELYVMSPPPLTIHQETAGNLYMRLANYLGGKTGKVFFAPFGVRLFPKEDFSDDTYVEPDIVLICDPSRIDRRGCNGPPDLAIEIVSPSNRSRDRVLKYNLYLDAGVREYWIVYPEYKEIDVNILGNNRYVTKTYGINEPDAEEKDRLEEIIPVTVLPGLTIDVKDIFR